MKIWNLYAKVYDKINENLPYLNMINDVIIESNFKNDMEIIDIGCGTANLEKNIIKSKISTKILGIDSSEEMLKIARKKIDNNNINFKYYKLDNKLDVPSNNYDRVMLINTLYSLKEPEQIIRESYRILKPGGKLIISNPHSKSKLRIIIREQLRQIGLLKFIYKFICNFPSLIIIFFVNIFFLRRNKNFWDKVTAEKILKVCCFTNIHIRLTYAGQNLLVSAYK